MQALRLSLLIRGFRFCFPQHLRAGMVQSKPMLDLPRGWTSHAPMQLLHRQYSQEKPVTADGRWHRTRWCWLRLGSLGHSINSEALAFGSCSNRLVRSPRGRFQTVGRRAQIAGCWSSGEQAVALRVSHHAVKCRDSRRDSTCPALPHSAYMVHLDMPRASKRHLILRFRASRLPIVVV
ncbi:hypothetical protein BU26DRAFT_125374 [Trematosphaeria pertusa]|uniref:Uncharacterized protein n=1 Tax=Trematosphaeria pertusa TaxID=390896 RepID=A0A6A6HXV0_9PLEO|nr:uncharacterized protein BU26DRAFT_125374 [Trematosphaeria pertusa]KAF2243045.1 hypothetical protein BU26DRAFT_125374 [Trematosphaeria pertusa]